MYSISRLIHSKHNAVIQIFHDLNGSHKTPFQALNAATKEQRLWIEAGQSNVRILIDDQIMTSLHAEHWAFEEYKLLPKCHCCAKILNEDVLTNKVDNHLFCSQICADKSYYSLYDRLDDQEEVEFR